MKRSTKGFTLIELLVVIAIIALLAALLFPVFARARQKAQFTACMSNMKQIWMATLMYSGDHNDRVPYVEDPWYYPDAKRQDLVQGDPTNQQLNPNSLINVTMPYTKSVGIWRCPAALKGYPGTSSKDWKQTYYFGAANTLYPDAPTPWTAQDAAELMRDQITDSYNLKFAYEYFDGRPIRLTVSNYTLTKDTSGAEHSSLFDRPIVECYTMTKERDGVPDYTFNGISENWRMPHQFKGYPARLVIHAVGEDGRVRIESFIKDSARLGIPKYGWSLTGGTGW